MRRISFLQVLSLASCIVNVHSSRGLCPRKTTFPGSYDPYIICELGGPTHAEGLPSEYNEHIYAELVTLCSSAHGARQNVGCFCSRANGDVHCDQNLADQNLWEANYNPHDDSVAHSFDVAGFYAGEVAFPDLCEHGCDCKDAEEAEDWFEDTFKGVDQHAVNGISGFVQPPEPSPRPLSQNTFGSGSLIDDNQEISSPGWQNQCGKNCSSAKDCSAPAGSNSTCMCQAHSSQYQPGAGTVRFLAACLVTLGSGGGKRQEGLPCPCNNTYVSQGCCGVPDGLVWEPPDAKMGELSTIP